MVHSPRMEMYRSWSAHSHSSTHEPLKAWSVVGCACSVGGWEQDNWEEILAAESSLHLLSHGTRAWLEIPHPLTGAQQVILEWNPHDKPAAPSYSYTLVNSNTLQIDHRPARAHPASVRLAFATPAERDDCADHLPNGWTEAKQDKTGSGPENDGTGASDGGGEVVLAGLSEKELGEVLGRILFEQGLGAMVREVKKALDAK